MTRRSPLQLRVLAPLVVLLSASVIIFFATRHHYHIAETRLVDEQLEKIKRTLGLLKQEIEHNYSSLSSTKSPYAESLHEGDSRRLLMSLAVDSTIEALALVNQTGQVLLANRIEWEGHQASGNLPYFNSPSPDLNIQGQVSAHLAADGQSIQAYVPIDLNSMKDSLRARERGTLYASYDLSAIQAAIWQEIRRDSAIIWLIASALLLGLVFILDRLITQPLSMLTAFSQRITDGHAEPQTADFYLREIAMLAQSLNTMREKIVQTVDNLNVQQENLDVTLNSIGDAVIATDERGLITRMNPVAEQLTGWYAHEARGQALQAVFPIIDASTRQTIANPVDKVLATGETIYLSNHTTLIARDGREYQIADSAAPIINADNKILGMILVFNDVTEQYRLRQAARNVQQQIQALFDDMQAMVGILDINGTVTFINNTPLKIKGLNSDDVIGKSFWDCAWFDFDLQAGRDIQVDCQLAAAGQQILRDIQVSNTQGQLIWVEFSIHPVFDETGLVTQLVAEGREISARKKAEEDLHDSLQHLKLYREQAPIATIEWTLDFQVKDWNEAASLLFGYTLEEIKNLDYINTMVAKDAIPDVLDIWQHTMAQSGGKIITVENLKKNGESILCEWHNTALLNDAGEVIGAASLVLNVTKEREAKRALVQKEQEQREILNTLVEGIITINQHGEILTCNPAAEKLFRYNTGELNDKNLTTIIPHFDINLADQYTSHHLRTGEAHVLGAQREAVGLRKDQTFFPLQIFAAELPQALDGTRRFIGSCKDLTEEKLQQEHFQRTQKMDALGKLVGGIAHDYNNMLGVILGYADLMTIKYQDIKGLDKYIASITQAGERGRDLTNRMLAFSKQELTRPEATELNSVLLSQKDLLSKAITALIQLDYQLCEDPWLSLIDPNELKDTLLNLALNAKHAMPNGGVLTVTTRKCRLSQTEADLLGLTSGDHIVLSVEDTGIGIEQNIQSKIFDPFFTTKGSDGTGLGLSQVYGFIERCNGAIKLFSTPGVGTRFSIYFPRFQGDLAQYLIQQSASNDLPGRGEKILVVDDEPALRELTCEILTLSGYQVLTASDGKAALELLAAETVDLVISDIIMPNMSGYELAKIIREKYPSIKIQLASGYNSEKSTEADDELHNTLLRKPFRSSELVNSVTELLRPIRDA